MGAGPTKYKPEDVENLPRLYPDEDYVIKTRAPMPGEWRINILRGKREDEHRHASYQIVRRKCYDNVMEFLDCQKKEGEFWSVFNCQEEIHYMKECFEKQLEIELDKRRRDTTKNTEWWWRELYDENGEIGPQAEWDGSSIFTMRINEFFGRSSTKKTDQTKTNVNS